MAYMVMLERNLLTKVGAQVLIDQISGAKSNVFDNDILKMLECATSAMELITNQE